MAEAQAIDFGTPVVPGTEWENSPQPVVPPVAPAVPAAAKPQSAATLGSALRTTKPVVAPKLPTGAPPEFPIPLSEQTFDEIVKNPLQALRVAQTDPVTSQINQLRLSLLAGKTESQAKEQEAKNAVLREEERTKFSEQYVKDAQNEARVRQSKIQEASPFAPTQESARDLASIFSLLSVAAFGSGGKGKYAGMQALSAMTGAMKGYKEGQKTIYDKEIKIFEENLQVIKSHNEEIQKEYTIAMDLLSKNKDLGEQKIKELAAKDNTGIQSMLARAHNYKGLGEAIKVVRDAAQKAQDKVDALKQKHADKAEERSYQERRDAAKFEQAKTLANMRIEAKGVGGPRSATNERFANNVIRSTSEGIRAVDQLAQLDSKTGGGYFATVIGKGTITSSIAAGLTGSITDEREKMYNATISGLSLEVAMAMSGGYKPDGKMQESLQETHRVTSSDSELTAAYKVADIIAKFKASLAVTPAYTPEQKKSRDELLVKLDKYETPENVMDKLSAVAPETAKPSVGKLTPAEQAELAALKAKHGR